MELSKNVNNKWTDSAGTNSTHCWIRELHPNIGVDILGVLDVEVDAPKNAHLTVRVIEVCVTSEEWKKRKITSIQKLDLAEKAQTSSRGSGLLSIWLLQHQQPQPVLKHKEMPRKEEGNYVSTIFQVEEKQSLQGQIVDIKALSLPNLGMDKGILSPNASRNLCIGVWSS